MSVLHTLTLVPPPTERDHPSRAMLAHGWTFVIDGSNYAYESTGQANVDCLLTFYRELRTCFIGAEFKILCDASLRHRFEGPQRNYFDRLIRDPIPLFFQCPAGKTADEFILRYASNRNQTIAVSNDLFNQPEERHLRIGVPILKVMVMGDEVIPAINIDLFPDRENPYYRVETPLEEYLGCENL
ncbi:MAG: hypothetical protein ACNA8W_16505 [Bradymonadaceae bacterium]